MNYALRIIFFFSLLLFTAQLKAQALRGIVVDANTGTPLHPVTVVNMATQQSAYTNERGEYLINAKSGESIAFSFFGYKTQQKYMPPSLSVVDMRIEMQPLTVTLNEFLVRPNYTQYQFDSIHRHSTYQRTLVRQRSSIMSPVSFIAERVSKKSRKIVEFQKSFNLWEDIRFVDSRYTPEIVHELTRLSGDSLANFMNAYPMPYDYARAASDLEIKMWIRNNYKAWIKNPFIINTSIDSLKQHK